MSVVLPAPFSPSRAWTSPPYMAKSMELLATTPENLFVIPFISIKGRAGCCRGGERSLNCKSILSNQKGGNRTLARPSD